MMSFESKVIDATIDKLINGQDYRSEVVNAINVQFLDFSISFFKDIIQAKLDCQTIDLDWYKQKFITNTNLTSDDIAIYAGMNKKTITNMHGSATRQIVLNVAETNSGAPRRIRTLNLLIRSQTECPAFPPFSTGCVQVSCKF